MSHESLTTNNPCCYLLLFPTSTTAISLPTPSLQRRSMQLLLTLFLFSWISIIHAGSVHHDQPCNIKLNRLLAGSLQFTSECDSQTFCNSTGLCQKRGCRRDDFPFGYSQGDKGIPDKCPKGQFCPDEMDQCQPLLPVGSPCQLNRDGVHCYPRRGRSFSLSF